MMMIYDENVTIIMITMMMIMIIKTMMIKRMIPTIIIVAMTMKMKLTI